MSITKAIFLAISLVTLGVIATFMVSTTPQVKASIPSTFEISRRELFEQWKIQYGKSYEIAEEEEKRFQFWSENYDFVQEHNKDPENTYTVGMNVFADISQSEWKALLSNCLVSTTAQRKNVKNIPASSNLPASIDWRTKNAVTPIKNQQQCGSCWAFSTTGSLEGLNAITKGSLKSFSEQQLVDCSDSYGNQGCNGGLMDYAFEYVASQGIELASSYPYTAQDGTCKYSSSKTVFKNTGYTDVPSQNNDALAAAVANQPVSIAIEADTSAFQLYTGGVFNNKGCGTNLDHGVLIVGYSTSGTPYWIVKNSWGSSWGESGYIRIAKQTGSGPGICGLALSASYPTLSSEEKGKNPTEEESASKLLFAAESENPEEPQGFDESEESEESGIYEGEFGGPENLYEFYEELYGGEPSRLEDEPCLEGEEYEEEGSEEESLEEEESAEETSEEEASEEAVSEEEGSEEEGSEEEGSEEEGSEETLSEEEGSEEEGSEEEGSEEEGSEEEGSEEDGAPILLFAEESEESEESTIYGGEQEDPENLYEWYEEIPIEEEAEESEEEGSEEEGSEEEGSEVEESEEEGSEEEGSEEEGSEEEGSEEEGSEEEGSEEEGSEEEGSEEEGSEKEGFEEEGSEIEGSEEEGAPILLFADESVISGGEQEDPENLYESSGEISSGEEEESDEEGSDEEESEEEGSEEEASEEQGSEEEGSEEEGSEEEGSEEEGSEVEGSEEEGSEEEVSEEERSEEEGSEEEATEEQGSEEDGSEEKGSEDEATEAPGIIEELDQEQAQVLEELEEVIEDYENDLSKEEVEEESA